LDAALEPLLVHYPASAENIRRARQQTAEWLGRLDVPEECVDDIRLAVSEAVSNVVLHAYRDGEADGGFELELRAAQDAIEVIVRDEGCGPQPHLASPGAGLGIPLIAALSSSLQIRNRSSGTEVHMTFTLPDC
jgi:serine/threonine-protein kinase RsbW